MEVLPQACATPRPPTGTLHTVQDLHAARNGTLTSAAPRSSSSPGTWLSMKSICSGSPSAGEARACQQASGGLQALAP